MKISGARAEVDVHPFETEAVTIKVVANLRDRLLHEVVHLRHDGIDQLAGLRDLEQLFDGSFARWARGRRRIGR